MSTIYFCLVAACICQPVNLQALFRINDKAVTVTGGTASSIQYMLQQMVVVREAALGL